MVEKSHTGGFWPSLYDPFRQARSRLAEWVAPASEASVNGDVYRITVELPGVREDDMEVTVSDGVVTLKGEKKTEREEKGDTWFFSEREYGAFSRSFRLPPDADDGKVDAELKDGVLTVTVPKRSEAPAKSSKVAVKKG